VFLGAERFQRHSVFRSTAFSGAQRFQEQSVFRSRAFLGADSFQEHSVFRSNPCNIVTCMQPYIQILVAFTKGDVRGCAKVADVW
jgi:hypothetical protein